MATDALTPEVQEFLRDRVRSFEELETLRVVRAQREEWWGADAVGAKLGIAPATADEALDALHGKGLLVMRRQAGMALYRHDAVDPALEALAAKAMRAYDENRIAVMQVMSRNAVERVRGGVIRTFADAFLVGRKKDG